MTVTDFTGCSVSSQVEIVITVSTLTNQFKEISIYPNPVSNLLQIDNPNTELLRYELSDILGRSLIIGENQETHFKLSMSQMLPGTYLLKIVNNSGEKQIFKIVKQ